MKYILTFLIICAFASGCNAQDETSENLTSVNMSMRRAAHTSTLLQDGRVLIAGGMQEDGKGNEISIPDAEIYDPNTDTFTKISSMNSPHSAHNAVLLPNGKVLIAGGWDISVRSVTVELFDPATETFTKLSDLSAPRSGMSMVLLENGKVLISGGTDKRDSYLSSAELFDPVTNTFSPTGNLLTGRYSHTSTLLNDGRVLLTGGESSTGILSEGEIYDPVAGKFIPAGKMTIERYKHAATILADGNVLIVGGSNANDWRGKYTSAEIYDVSKKEFVKVTDMQGERFKMTDAVILLPDGKVLVGGGNKLIEIFDPALKTFSTAGILSDPLYYSTVTLLKNGTVLISGGYNNNIAATSSAWIYKSL